MESENKIQKSMGWSLFSEVAAKFVIPASNMILARVLAPDEFGVVAVCNMLVSFVDLITDAGFGYSMILKMIMKKINMQMCRFGLI